MTEVIDISLYSECSSASVRSASAATSASVGLRCRLDSRRPSAACTARALERTDRGTQSCARRSSRMAPRTRCMAYVSNFQPRSGSKRSIASMSPKMPACTRSAASTCCGRPVPTRPATYLTMGA